MQAGQAGKFKVQYMCNKDQIADGFTKALSRQSFLFLRSKIGIANDSFVLRVPIRTLSNKIDNVQYVDKGSVLYFKLIISPSCLSI